MKTIVINGVNCYIRNGVVYLNLREVAKGLGYTLDLVDAKGRKYTTFQTARVDKRLRRAGLKTGKHRPSYITQAVFEEFAATPRKKEYQDFANELRHGIFETFHINKVENPVPEETSVAPVSTDASIQTFTNAEFGSIRTVDVDGEPWFVGKDVADVLGYGDTAQAIRKHIDADDKGVVDLTTPGGKQKVIIINESGLYALILSSKLPSAKKFKRWVTSEVLPAIRKTGTYMTVPTDNTNITANLNTIGKFFELALETVNVLRDVHTRGAEMTAEIEKLRLSNAALNGENERLYDMNSALERKIEYLSAAKTST